MCLAAAVLLGSSSAWVSNPSISRRSTQTQTQLQMGLFDGVKEAFSAPPLEKTSISSERETPIDRWMGWSVVSENVPQQQASKYILCVCYSDLPTVFFQDYFAIHQHNSRLTHSFFLCFLRMTAPADFIDSMDSNNYIAIQLQKPMGIIFEENDEEYGGIFVQALKEGGIASTHGVAQAGDQLVAVDTIKVSGMSFDDALGKIIESQGESTKLTLFRGSAKQLYGPTGASQAWLDEFVTGGSVMPTTAE